MSEDRTPEFQYSFTNQLSKMVEEIKGAHERWRGNDRMKRIDPELTKEQLDKIKKMADDFVESADSLYDRYLVVLAEEMRVDDRRIASHYQEKVQQSLLGTVDWIPEHEY